MEAWTDADFDTLSWHDCRLWRMALRPGNPQREEWTSDLVFDIDFITEWLCGADGGHQFLVAPATLTFHGVTDLRVAVDWGNSGNRTALHEISIDRLEREALSGQQGFLDGPYFRWTIHLNWPSGGRFTFGAVGFSQQLTGLGVLKAEQHLTAEERAAGRLARLKRHGKRRLPEPGDRS